MREEIEGFISRISAHYVSDQDVFVQGAHSKAFLVYRALDRHVSIPLVREARRMIAETSFPDNVTVFVSWRSRDTVRVEWKQVDGLTEAVFLILSWKQERDKEFKEQNGET